MHKMFVVSLKLKILLNKNETLTPWPMLMLQINVGHYGDNVHK